MSEQWKLNDEESHGQAAAGGETSGGEAGWGEPQKRHISSNVLMVGGVFVIALALIWALGKQAGPRSAAAAEGADDKVDSAIKELLERTGKGEQIKNLFRDTDALVKMFYNYPGVSSVPLEELPGNPFEHQTAAVANDPIPVMAVNPSIAEEARMQKLAESFKGLKLQTVLLSKTRSAAMINNRMIMVGGRIGEFTVSEIQPERVILSAGSARFELKQDTPASGARVRAQPDDQ